MTDTAMLGGTTDCTGIGAQLAALAGGVIALLMGLFVAVRRPRRLTTRPIAPTGPWSTTRFDGRR
jgi:hypothetical protein